jgi:hypothetical protein
MGETTSATSTSYAICPSMLEHPGTSTLVTPVRGGVVRFGAPFPTLCEIGCHLTLLSQSWMALFLLVMVVAYADSRMLMIFSLVRRLR